MNLLSPLLTAITIAAPSAYCPNDAVFRKLVPELKTEKYTCLDSAQTGKLEKTIYYRDGQKGDSARILVIEASLKKGIPARLAGKPTLLAEAELLPQGCGSYLMGARVLPASSSIALLYAEAVLRVVDGKTGAVLTTVDHTDPDMGSICNGYSPNAKARRDEVKVDGVKKSVSYMYYDYKEMVEVCSEHPLQDFEKAGLNDDIKRTVANIKRREKEVAEAKNDSDRKWAQEQLDHATKMLPELERRKKTGVARDCYGQAAKKDGVLSY